MQYLLFEDVIPAHYLEGIQKLHQDIFDGALIREVKLQREKLMAVVALQEGEVIAFKLGYEKEQGIFFSWLGGVDARYRGRQIAQQCMSLQHQWCEQRGYSKIQTYGRNERKAMLIMNLKVGFNIHSTFVDHKGRFKILLEKEISTK